MIAVNLRQTAEVAALVATSAAHIVESPDPIPTESLHGYWKQSRTRLKCWFAALRAVQCQGGGSRQAFTSFQQDQIVTLCREILVAEMLTRIWSTVLICADQRQKAGHARSTAESVFRGHLEARHEVLELLTEDGVLSLADQMTLNRFRRRIERWTDALLGPLVARYRVAEYVFNEERARDFSENAHQERLDDATAAMTPLLLAGIASTIPTDCAADRERNMLNLSIARAILMAFPPEAFGNDGRLRSMKQGTIERSSRQTESPPPRESTGQSVLSFFELRRRERQQDQIGD